MSENTKAESKQRKEAVKARISAKDLSDETHDAIVAMAAKALKQYDNGEKKYYTDIAAQIKTDMDAKYGGTWHVIVGVSYGSFITHELQKMTYFWIGAVGFLVWQHG